MLKHYKKAFKTGFTILETLVAVVLFSFAITAAMGLTTASLRIFAEARRSFIASQIAREGVEMVLAKHANHIVCLLGGSCPISDWQDNLVRAASQQVESPRSNEGTVAQLNF